MIFPINDPPSPSPLHNFGVLVRTFFFLIKSCASTINEQMLDSCVPLFSHLITQFSKKNKKLKTFFFGIGICEQQTRAHTNTHCLHTTPSRTAQKNTPACHHVCSKRETKSFFFKSPPSNKLNSIKSSPLPLWGRSLLLPVFFFLFSFPH